jgi:hypothetical protein
MTDGLQCPECGGAIYAARRDDGTITLACKLLHECQLVITRVIMNPEATVTVTMGNDSQEKR